MMDATDRPAFVAAFKRLALSFRLKMRPAEVDNLSGIYFTMMEAYPLHEVVAAGNATIRSFRRFPKPADWLDVITRDKVGAPPDVRVMTTTEASEYVRAERLRYEDDPCSCLLCQAVGTTRPLRFVPDFTDQDRDEKAFCQPKQKTVTVGHWIHGADLERWYVARDAFFGAAGQAGVYANVLRRFGFTYRPPSREPGQEG